MAVHLWQSQLRQGSFRGVFFSTQNSDSIEGRRSVVFDLPGSENYIVQDVGVRQKEYTLNVFVYGETYRAKRDSLLKALNTVGVGMLVHPYYGKFKAQVKGEVTVKEGAELGGIAFITFSVIRIPEQKSSKFDTLYQALDKINNIIAEINDSFSIIFSIADATAAVVNIATNLADSATNITNSINSLAHLPNNVKSIISSDITLFQTSIAQNLRNPKIFAEGYSAILKSITEAIYSNGTTKEQLAILQNIFNGAVKFQKENTSESIQNEQIKENSNAQVVLTSGLLLLNGCKTALNIDYKSSNQVKSIIKLIQSTTYELLPSINYDLYENLEQVRQATITTLKEKMLGLPELATINIDNPTPLLLIANSTGNTVEALLELNTIVNPLFVTGTIVYEVGVNNG